jgi:hypothetical protein
LGHSFADVNADIAVCPLCAKTRHRDARTVKRYCKNLRLSKSERQQMTLSAISHYRGGTIDVVAPLAKTLKAIYLKYGVGYRLSRFEAGPNVGD